MAIPRPRPVSVRPSAVGADDVVDGLLGDIDRLRHEVTTLRRSVRARTSVDRATGIVMAGHGIDAAPATLQLRRWAGDLGVEVHVLAATMVAAASDPALRDFDPPGSRRSGPEGSPTGR